MLTNFSLVCDDCDYDGNGGGGGGGVCGGGGGGGGCSSEGDDGVAVSELIFFFLITNIHKLYCVTSKFMVTQTSSTLCYC